MPLYTHLQIKNYDIAYAPVNKPSQQFNTTDQKSYNLNVQSDYTHPFNPQRKFEAGYKGTFRSNDNDYTFDTLDYNSGIIVRNFDLTNHFKLTEHISAFYGMLSGKV